MSASSAAESEAFTYDSNDNLTKLVNADGTNYSYGYDSNGNLMTAQTSDGQGSIYTNNQSEAQKWQLKKLDDGSYQIIAKCTSDANCLTNYQD